MVTEQPQVKPNSRFTPTEAARTLGVSRNTIYRYITAQVFMPRDISFGRNGKMTFLELV